MRASRGEIKIEEILEEAGLPFKMEYIFPDLKSPNGRPLRFDFVIFDDDGRLILSLNIRANSIMKLALSSVVNAVYTNSNIMTIKKGVFVLYMILN